MLTSVASCAASAKGSGGGAATARPVGTTLPDNLLALTAGFLMAVFAPPLNSALVLPASAITTKVRSMWTVLVKEFFGAKHRRGIQEVPRLADRSEGTDIPPRRRHRLFSSALDDGPRCGAVVNAVAKRLPNDG